MSACKARMPIAAKFCSECGYNFSSTDNGPIEKDEDLVVADRAEGNESVEKPSSSARCSISLKSSGNDKDAVAQELCSLFNRTWGGPEVLSSERRFLCIWMSHGMRPSGLPTCWRGSAQRLSFLTMMPERRRTGIARSCCSAFRQG